jgi:hypothetical protein
MQVRIKVVALAAVAAAALSIVTTEGVAATQGREGHPQAHPEYLAGCKGSTCTGKNPHTTGCDKDATTIAQATAPGGGLIVSLRRSRACGAAWAYAPNKWESYSFRLERRNGAPYVETASFQRPTYTPMAGTSGYRACAISFDGGSKACTRWF